MKSRFEELAKGGGIYKKPLLKGGRGVKKPFLGGTCWIRTEKCRRADPKLKRHQRSVHVWSAITLEKESVEGAGQSSPTGIHEKGKIGGCATLVPTYVDGAASLLRSLTTCWPEGNPVCRQSFCQCDRSSNARLPMYSGQPRCEE